MAAGTTTANVGARRKPVSARDDIEHPKKNDALQGPPDVPSNRRKRFMAYAADRVNKLRSTLHYVTINMFNLSTGGAPSTTPPRSPRLAPMVGRQRVQQGRRRPMVRGVRRRILGNIRTIMTCTALVVSCAWTAIAEPMVTPVLQLASTQTHTYDIYSQTAPSARSRRRARNRN